MGSALCFAMVAVPLLGAALCALSRFGERRCEIISAFICAIVMCAAVVSVQNPAWGEVSLNLLLPGGIGFTSDGFRAIYCAVTAYMWLSSTLFCKSYFKNGRARGC